MHQNRRAGKEQAGTWIRPDEAGIAIDRNLKGSAQRCGAFATISIVSATGRLETPAWRLARNASLRTKVSLDPAAGGASDHLQSPRKILLTAIV
jgi:hypothetical protein